LKHSDYRSRQNNRLFNHSRLFYLCVTLLDHHNSNSTYLSYFMPRCAEYHAGLHNPFTSHSNCESNRIAFDSKHAILRHVIHLLGSWFQHYFTELKNLKSLVTMYACRLLLPQPKDLQLEANLRN